MAVFLFLFLGLDHPHSLSYKLELGSDQEIPSDWYPFATVQFVVHDTCASGTEVMSLGIESDLQPQKHVVQKAFYNCQVFSGLCFPCFPPLLPPCSPIQYLESKCALYSKHILQVLLIMTSSKRIIK